MLARQGIAKHFGINPKDIKFRCDQNGKPYAEGLDIHFSLSHSGDLAVCAISDTPVGIDVEKVRHVNTGVAKKWFTEQEQAFVFSDKTKAQRRFFEIWTKKEAYIKAKGLRLIDGSGVNVLDCPDAKFFTETKGKNMVTLCKITNIF